MGFEEKLVWKTPELIVLVRSRPEEAVLTGCKISGSTTQPQSTESGCMKGNKKCKNCNAITSS